MTRVALVLGAGGITGTAWLLGALEAIEEATGWDPRSADVVCGTSAGSVAAAVLAGGVPTETLVEMAERPEVLQRQSERATGRAPARRGLPTSWPGSLALGLTGLVATDPRHRATSLVGFAPRGSKPCDEIRGLVHEATRGGWPASPRLLLNACDYRTGRRVTFDAGSGVDLADAVTASAAVPGWYQPVRIDGRDYVDGGLASFTNADVVAAERPDVVLCLSPFSSSDLAGVRDTGVFGALRQAVRLQLRREAAARRSAGARVAIVEPCRRDLRTMGLNVMERRHARAVVETARATTRERVHDLLRDVELPSRVAEPALAA